MSAPTGTRCRSAGRSPATRSSRTWSSLAQLIDEDGERPDEDQWDGYPVERDALLARFESLDHVVVLSADIHASVASQLARDRSPVAVEITAPSLPSQNLDEKLELDPRDETIVACERAFLETLDHVAWCEFSGHGYVVRDVDRERIRAEWWLVDGGGDSGPMSCRGARLTPARTA